MKLEKFFFKLSLLAFIFIFSQCNDDAILMDDLSIEDQSIELSSKGEKKTVTDEEGSGNNLSFPVIWSDGVAKAVNGTMGEYSLQGEWWYVWGEEPIDPMSEICSCKPNPVNIELCEDGSVPGDGGITEVYKVYIQKDPLNVWQADNWNGVGDTNVDLIDWGDNLESIDWTIKSQVRTEVVLYKNLSTPVIEYPMRHVDSWGIDEIHGIQTNDGTPVSIAENGSQATVFTPNARLTIQKLHVNSLDKLTGNLRWRNRLGWIETDEYIGDDLVNNNPLFNMAVHEASDGPGYYNAEINVKGKVIFGYTWNVRKLNEDVGYYRITFSFDNDSGIALNTFFNNNTEIILPIEEEITIMSNDVEGTRGGTAIIDANNNLTYMDILFLPKTTSGGGGQGGNGNN